MKEIPMLFSTPMVHAILEGRKTQTRRIMKPQIKDCDHAGFVEAEWKDKPIHWSELALQKGRAYCGRCGNGIEYSKDYGGIKCPYGQDGDIFYVREEHYRYGAWVEKEGHYTKGGRQKWMFVAHTDELLYEAPTEFRKGRHHKDPFTPAWHKRLARFMPKSAARIWLQKEATKVERACDISFADAVAEGLACISKDGGITWKYGIPDFDGLPGTDNIGWPWQEWEVDPVTAFKKLWCKINGIETWNEWVWANSFTVLSTTGKPVIPLTEKA